MTQDKNNVINIDFVQDAAGSIPEAPQELQERASETMSILLGTFWTAGYLYGYNDGCTESETDGR